MKIRWINRTGAMDFIRQQMQQGKSFDIAFVEMKRVAKKMGFIRKSATLDLMSSKSYTKLRNECVRRPDNRGA